MPMQTPKRSVDTTFIVDVTDEAIETLQTELDRDIIALYETIEDEEALIHWEKELELELMFD